MTAVELPFERVALLLGLCTAEALVPVPVHVRHLPVWVREYGVAASPDALWIWLAGDPVSSDGPGPMGQVVLDMPHGRYVVDALEPTTGLCYSRETTAASPLVLGVSRGSGSVAIRIEALQPSS